MGPKWLVWRRGTIGINRIRSSPRRSSSVYPILSWPILTAYFLIDSPWFLVGVCGVLLSCWLLYNPAKGPCKESLSLNRSKKQSF
jgi:hypothetical protein